MGLGRGDPNMVLGMRAWRPLHWVWGAGALTLGLGPGFGDLFIGVGMKGPLCQGQDSGSPALRIGGHHMETAASPEAHWAGNGGTVGTGCVCSLPPHRDRDRGQIRAPAPPWLALDNSDAAPELLNPILIQPSLPKPRCHEEETSQWEGAGSCSPPAASPGHHQVSRGEFPTGGGPGHPERRFESGSFPKPSPQAGLIALR